MRPASMLTPNLTETSRDLTIMFMCRWLRPAVLRPRQTEDWSVRYICRKRLRYFFYKSFINASEVLVLDICPGHIQDRIYHHPQIDVLVHEIRNSSALAIELCLSCINPSRCQHWVHPKDPHSKLHVVFSNFLLIALISSTYRVGRRYLKWPTRSPEISWCFEIFKLSSSTSAISCSVFQMIFPITLTTLGLYLPQDLVKSKSREIGCYDHRIALKFESSRQRCYRGACQISERLVKSKSESRGFARCCETSRDFAVRRPSA